MFPGSKKYIYVLITHNVSLKRSFVLGEETQKINFMFVCLV